jgi:hypothetical protein
VTRAADIISSDDDFDNMLAYGQATYAYEQGAPQYHSTPAVSAAEEDAADEGDEDEQGGGDDPDDPSVSVSGDEEDDDDDDF